jgi:hypothetical protein
MNDPLSDTDTDFASENVGRHVLAYLQQIKATPLAKLDDFDEEGNATVGQVIKVWIRLHYSSPAGALKLPFRQS